MIQRIQSIYLTVVALLSLGMAYLSDSIIDIVQNAKEEIIFYVVSALLATWSLLYFKKRSFQIIIDNINIIINVLLIGISVYFLLSLPGADENAKKGIWLIVPFVNVVLLILANFNIKKDIELVKSVDRIR